MAEDDIKLAREQFEESFQGSDFNRQAAEQDVRFARLSEQWDPIVKSTRQNEGRPCLTVNRLPGFIRQVVNDARQAKTGVRVSPVDSGADQATAEVLQGLIRHIERRSVAEIAYDTAIDHAVTSGFGFFRLGIDYVHEKSFDLELKIQRIANPLMVYWDTASVEYNASDWRYAFVSEYLPEDEFETRYPDAAKTSFDGGPQSFVGSLLERHIHTVEYWRKDMEPFDLVAIRAPDGSVQTLPEEELAKIARSILEQGGMSADEGSDEDAVRAVMALGFEEIRRRKSERPNVRRMILSGDEVLEQTEWPGRTIPICPVWGDEVIVDGKRHFRSMIRDAKDPQAMMNFWRSATTELVALAPKSPWLIEENALPSDGDELDKWANANTRNFDYLTWNGASGAPMPTRNQFAGVPAGALQEAQLAQDDIKAIIGIYDSSLGARSNETSGRAILARQREADVSNFHFIDNLNRAIQYAGQCMVDAIPAVTSGTEMLRILGEDSKERLVRLASNQDGLSAGEMVNGEDRIYNLNTGIYDVSVDAGPSYATQREDAREVMMELGRSVPAFWSVSADIFMRNLDFQGSDELEERLAPLVQGQIAQLGGGQPQPGQPGQQPGQPPMPNGAPQQL